MNIQTLMLVLVLIAAFGSALWNIRVKKSNNSLVFVTLMVIPQFLIALPLTLILPLPSEESWGYIAGSAVAQTFYIIFLSNAYKHGMLNRIYPLAIGTTPLIAMIFWHVFLMTSLVAKDYYGVILLSIGIMSFAFAGKWNKEVLSIKGVFYAFGVSILTFLYSLIDTFGIRITNYPFSYIVWVFLIKAVLLFIPMLFLHKIHIRSMMRKSSDYIMAGLLAGFGYAIAMLAFIYESTSVVLALRSTSILFTFSLSILILKEKASYKTLLFTMMTALGVFLIMI